MAGSKAYYGFQYKQKFYLIKQCFDGYRAKFGVSIIQQIQGAIKDDQIKNWPKKIEEMNQYDFMSRSQEFLTDLGWDLPLEEQPINKYQKTSKWLQAVTKQGPFLQTILDSGYILDNEADFPEFKTFLLSESGVAYIVNLDSQKLDFYCHNSRRPRDSFLFSNLPLEQWSRCDENRDGIPRLSSGHEPLCLFFSGWKMNIKRYKTYIPSFRSFTLDPIAIGYYLIDAISKNRQIVILTHSVGIVRALLLLEEMNINSGQIFRFINMDPSCLHPETIEHKMETYEPGLRVLFQQYLHVSRKVNLVTKYPSKNYLSEDRRAQTQLFPVEWIEYYESPSQDKQQADSSEHPILQLTSHHPYMIKSVRDKILKELIPTVSNREKRKTKQHVKNSNLEEVKKD
jgi:hypothetical protein